MAKMVMAVLVGIMAMSSVANADNDASQSITHVAGHGEVDTSFAINRARLERVGYREVRMLRDDPTRLTCYDREGSEVAVRLHPDSGDVIEVMPVRMMDR